MKTLVFVRLFSGKVVCYVERDNYSMEEWQQLFSGVGDVVEVKHADLVCVNYML